MKAEGGGDRGRDQGRVMEGGMAPLTMNKGQWARVIDDVGRGRGWRVSSTTCRGGSNSCRHHIFEIFFCPPLANRWAILIR